jgi:hypothetical protein
VSPLGVTIGPKTAARGASIRATMASAEKDRDVWLIDQLLSAYEGGTWANERSTKKADDKRTYRAVDMIATRRSDGLKLLVEHTLVEPFDGDRKEYHGRFEKLQAALRNDLSLRVPGVALFLDMPRDTLPSRVDWSAIAADVAEWVRSANPSFPLDKAARRCPCPHHPSRELILQVARLPLPDNPEVSCVIVARYGKPHLAEVVGKALKHKLPKLVDTPGDRRMLLLEVDQTAVVTPADVRAEVERRRLDFPKLARVDEVWVVNTAAFGDPQFAQFLGPRREDFGFYGGRLQWSSATWGRR